MYTKIEIAINNAKARLSNTEKELVALLAKKESEERILMDLEAINERDHPHDNSVKESK